jgi:hypothetical protein
MYGYAAKLKLLSNGNTFNMVARQSSKAQMMRSFFFSHDISGWVAPQARW